MKYAASRRNGLRRLATGGILTAIAMILSWIEFILPFSIGIPGVKLGLCHIVTLLAVYQLTAWEAFSVTAVRIFLTAILFGNVASLAYSAVGGLLSLTVMLILHRLKWHEKPLFSPIGVSIAGAVAHNIGQLGTAALILQTASVVTYMPVLLAAGVITGMVIGSVSAIIHTKLSKKV